MQSIAVFTAPAEGAVSINGRFAGEAGPGRPLIMPVTPEGVLYIHFMPFVRRLRHCAYRVRIRGGRFELLNAGDMCRVVEWPGGIYEFELLPPAAYPPESEFGTIDGNTTFCISDVFLACRDILAGENEHVCGKVYGFLDEPYGVTEAVTVTADEMKRSAAEINADGFLPTEITVGGKKIGPADWLFAAMDIICGADSVTVTPREQIPSLDILPDLKKAKSMRGWINGDELEDNYLTKRLKLQIWTMRFLGE